MISDKSPKAVPQNEEIAKQMQEAAQVKSNEKTVQITGYMAMLKAQWEATHPRERAPIFLDADGKPMWLNRKERKARDAVFLRQQRKLLKSAQRELKVQEYSNLIPDDLKAIYKEGFVGIRGFEFYPKAEVGNPLGEGKDQTPSEGSVPPAQE